MERPDSKRRLEALGYEFEALKNGTAELVAEDAVKLFNEDVAEASADAKSIFKTFDTLPEDKQGVLTQMVFQLGKTKANKFNEVKKALIAGDFDKASKEMLNSEWAKQTPARVKRLAKRLKG
jgi:lysozyme